MVQEANTAAELQQIFELRYKILRQPWQQPFETSFDELESTSCNAFIADSSGKVLACGRLQNNGHGVGQIRYMAVDTLHQGKWYGKRIVDFLEEKAFSWGLSKLELQARENALQFYKKNGYKIKEKTFLLWGIVQHYLMEKELEKTNPNSATLNASNL